MADSEVFQAGMTGQIDCDQALRLIDSLWEEVLSDENWVLLAKHLDSCPSCAGLLEDLDELAGQPLVDHQLVP